MSKSMRKIDRDELLRRVTHLEITLDEADAVAARCGLEPLNSDPDPSVFDPMSEVRWSLPMGLAWIIWRDPDRVRWQWDRWRREKLVWAEQMLPGRDAIEYHLVPLKRNFGSWSDVVLDTSVREAIGHVPVVAPDAAKSDLWKLFQEGKLDPDGINADTDRREPIDARQFQDLEIITGGDKTPDILSAGLGRIVFHDVSVSRDELLNKFPETTADPESDCLRWLNAELTKKDASAAKRRDDYLNDALKKFVGLTKRGFKRCWDQAVKDTGSTASKPGRKKSKR